MKKQYLIVLLLMISVNGSVSAQNAEVEKIARQFCRSTNNFFYFKSDKKLEDKLVLPLSEIFDYKEATYFVSTSTKTIMILPSTSLNDNLLKATKYFEETKKYSFAVRGLSRTMFIGEKPVYRFYPYKNTIIFELFDSI